MQKIASQQSQNDRQTNSDSFGVSHKSQEQREDNENVLTQCQDRKIHSQNIGKNTGKGQTLSQGALSLRQSQDSQGKDQMRLSETEGRGAIQSGPESVAVTSDRV